MGGIIKGVFHTHMILPSYPTTAAIACRFSTDRQREGPGFPSPYPLMADFPIVLAGQWVKFRHFLLLLITDHLSIPVVFQNTIQTFPIGPILAIVWCELL